MEFKASLGLEPEPGLELEIFKVLNFAVLEGDYLFFALDSVTRQLRPHHFSAGRRNLTTPGDSELEFHLIQDNTPGAK